MTCKDCIHIEQCLDVWNEYTENAEITCKNFKDKSKFIELPCKVGDTVYILLQGYRNVILVRTIIKISIDENNIVYIANHASHFQANDIGHSVFVTQEEAEKTLKERENNA